MVLIKLSRREMSSSLSPVGDSHQLMPNRRTSWMTSDVNGLIFKCCLKSYRQAFSYVSTSVRSQALKFLTLIYEIVNIFRWSTYPLSIFVRACMPYTLLIESLRPTARYKRWTVTWNHTDLQSRLVIPLVWVVLNQQKGPDRLGVVINCIRVL